MSRCQVIGWFLPSESGCWVVCGETSSYVEVHSWSEVGIYWQIAMGRTDRPLPLKTYIIGALAQWYWKLLSAIQFYTLKCSSLCELLLKIRNFTDFLHPSCCMNVCRETCMEIHYNIDDHRPLVLDCGSCYFPLNNWGFDSYIVLLNSLLQL